MTPANVLSYYAQANWGTRFGVVDIAHPNGHRGLDIQHPAGTPIPALRAGTVTMVRYSSIIGNVVVVQVADTDFDGYAHTINARVGPGYKVSQGEIIAWVAGSGDPHGSSWSGPHTHLTNSPNGTGIFQGSVRDPAPVVAAILATTSSSSSSPLNGTEVDMAKPEFMQWGNIYWPNGYFAGYQTDVYNAIKYYFDNGTEEPGTVGTIAREINIANEAVAARAAAHVAAAIGSVVVAPPAPPVINPPPVGYTPRFDKIDAAIAAIPAPPTHIQGVIS